MATETDTEAPTLTPMEQIQLEFDLGYFDQPEDFDGSEYAHFVGKDGLVEAMVNGGYVQALCGWFFIPMRDPNKFPVCPRCKDLQGMLPE